MDDRVDGEAVVPGLRRQLGDGPAGPLRIVLQNVDQDMGIDQQDPLFTAQESHQLVGAPLHVGLAARSVEAVRLAAGAVDDLVNDDLAFLVDGEFDSGARREVEQQREESVLA